MSALPPAPETIRPSVRAYARALGRAANTAAIEFKALNCSLSHRRLRDRAQAEDDAIGGFLSVFFGWCFLAGWFAD